MPSFLPFARLYRIYWPLALASLYTTYSVGRVSCIDPFRIPANLSRYFNISGLGGLQCAFLIAFKQLVPEHTVTLFRSPIKIRVKVLLFQGRSLIVALPRTVPVHRSLDSTLPRNVRILTISPHHLHDSLDLPPLLQT